MRPILELSAASRLPPFLNPIDGTIVRPESRGGYDYEVLSDADPDAPQVDEKSPLRTGHEMLAGDPRGALKARFREIAAARGATACQARGYRGDHAPGQGAGVRTSAIRASSATRSTWTSVDPSLDPVEDFLVNRKEGHCEYFASALALLLRSIDIPARMVNGFKGGDWNELTQSMNVRQKHAHSWVEAYVGQDATRAGPIWITLDPTPGTERDESVARSAGLPATSAVTDLVRYVWVFYILGYNAERQNRLLYTPIKAMIREVRRGYAMIWELAKQGVRPAVQFPEPRLVHQRPGLLRLVPRALAAGRAGEAGRLGWASGCSCGGAARSTTRPG